MLQSDDLCNLNACEPGKARLDGLIPYQEYNVELVANFDNDLTLSAKTEFKEGPLVEIRFIEEWKPYVA